MEDETVETRVIFKVIEGELIAFLLDVPANKNYITCYAHIGQHSEAHQLYFEEGRLATDRELEPLRCELESLGYRLYLRSRRRKNN